MELFPEEKNLVALYRLPPEQMRMPYTYGPCSATLLFLVIFTCQFSFSQSAPLFEHFTSAQGLSSDEVFDAVQTQDGNIWFGTSNGICRFDGIGFLCFGSKEGLTDPVISGLYLDKHGKLWCWTSSERIFRNENQRFSPLHENDLMAAEIQGRIINSIAIENNGTVWVGTVIPGSLLKSIPGTGIEKTPLPGNGDCSFYIYKTPDSSHVHGTVKIMGESSRLAITSGKKAMMVSLSEKDNFSKSSFFTLGNGSFLYAKGQEIIHFSEGKVKQRSFTEKNVQDIMMDSEGKIWVGLYMGGAVCYPGGTLSAAGVINYLGNKSVSSIMEDNAGNLWFTTLGDGIFYLPVRSGMAYSSPRIYSHKNESDFPEKPKALTSAGSMAPASRSSGLRLVSTDTSLADTMPPSIFISGIKIMERDTLVLDHYDLAFDQNFLRIHFAGFDYGNPDALKYRYRMDGIDKGWTYTDNTFAQYTTLPAGKYRFMVSAMNNNGIWNDTPATLSFTIYPPFWKTWWFLSLATAGIGGLVTLVFFKRIAQIKAREKERAEITKQMAAAELQALRAQMNPHFIFNTLSSIQHFITTNETKDALNYLSKFARLMRKIMDNSKKSVIPLKEEMEALHLYLELEVLRFKNKFEYAICLDENIDLNDDEIPPMLIQPYIENAILHGLMHRNENSGGQLKIEIKKQDERIICSIEDNGIGREKSGEINRNKKNGHVSSGMSITKNRLEILNALHQSNLSVSIIDLKKGIEPAGTRVELFIPL